VPAASVIWFEAIDAMPAGSAFSVWSGRVCQVPPVV
jgi:hypothetical protein